MKAIPDGRLHLAHVQPCTGARTNVNGRVEKVLEAAATAAGAGAAGSAAERGQAVSPGLSGAGCAGGVYVYVDSGVGCK